MVYVVLSNLFSNGYFGIFSSLLNARQAIEDYAHYDENIKFCYDDGDYCYKVITNSNNVYTFTISADCIDD